VIARVPDISGYYESTDGLITVQINQAAHYISGFMQERKPRTIHDPTTPDTYQLHDLNYYEIDGGAFYYYQGIESTIPSPFSITSEVIEDGDYLVLRWTLSDGRQFVLARYDESPVLSDETLNGLPKTAQGVLPDSAQVFVLSHRAPIGPYNETTLDDAVSTIKAYLQAFHGAIFLPPDPFQQAVWLLELRRFGQAYIVTNAGLIHQAENDQLALLRFMLREKLQWTALEVSETDTRNLYMAFLEVVQYYGESNLTDLDKFILDITGITFEEATLILDEEATEALASGTYTYEFRTLNLGVGLTVMPFTVGVAAIGVEVRRISGEGSSPTVHWNTYYFGLMELGGFALGANAKINIKDILKEIAKSLAGSRSNWSKLYAYEQWEPDDFSGLMTVYSSGASAAYYIGVQFSFDSRTTFFELNKGFDVGHGRLISRTTARSLSDVLSSIDVTFALGASITATLGHAQLAQVPYFGNVDENGFFEPMIAASTYMTELPQDTSGVHFAVNDDLLNPDGQAIIQRLVARLRAYFISTYTRLEIHGPQRVRSIQS
jgi:hypothetical protein